jgi:hypothetical protein
VAVTANKVVGRHDTRDHVIQAPFGDGSVDDGKGQVRAPEGVAAVEIGVTLHC